MNAMASQITSISTVCSTVCSDAHQRKQLRATGLWEGNPPVTGGFPSKGSVKQKMFRFDDVIIFWFLWSCSPFGCIFWLPMHSVCFFKDIGQCGCDCQCLYRGKEPRRVKGFIRSPGCDPKQHTTWSRPCARHSNAINRLQSQIFHLFKNTSAWHYWPLREGFTGHLVESPYKGASNASSYTLQWRHNERDGVSNHRRIECLPNRLFRWRSEKTSWSSPSLAFVRGIHRWPVNFPHKRLATRKMFQFDYIII